VPVWSYDGQRVAFQSDRESDLAIFWHLLYPETRWLRGHQRRDAADLHFRKTSGGAEAVSWSWSRRAKDLRHYSWRQDCRRGRGRPDGVRSATAQQIHVVLNWVEELKQRVPRQD